MNALSRILAASLIFSGMEVKSQDALTPPVSGIEVRSALKSLRRESPRLLLTSERLKWLRSSDAPLVRRYAGAVVTEAERIAQRPVLERIVTGRRLLEVSREAFWRMQCLGLGYHLTGRREFLDRARSELESVARFSDWNPSHFLDTAEMTSAVAIGYDWLREELPEATRTLLRDAIVRKGLEASYNPRSNLRWLNSRNNWAQVCHGGLVAGALAIADDEPELAALVVTRAVESLPRAMQASYYPRGVYPEGFGYWSYGTNYNVILIELLRTALGTDFGLAAQPGFPESVDYMAQMVGPSGYSFNFSDAADEKAGFDPAFLWFESNYETVPVPGFNLEGLQQKLEQRSLTGRFDPLGLIYLAAGNGNRNGRSVVLSEDYLGQGKVGVAAHRSSWSDDQALYVAIKAGSPNAPHAHMDGGSFVLDASGERWVADLGHQEYHSLERLGLNLWDMTQGSDRWRIFRLGGRSHNIPLIDGRDQKVRASAHLVRHSTSESFPHTVVDLSDLYEGQARQVVRGVALPGRREVVVHDVFEGLSPNDEVRWSILTRAEVELQGHAHAAVLRQNGKELTLNIRSSMPGKLAIVDAAEPRASYDVANPGAKQIELRMTADASGRAAIVARFVRDEALARPLPEAALAHPLHWSEPLARPPQAGADLLQ